MTTEEVKQRQRFLKSIGFDPGKIDGLWGKHSQRAEDNYQASLKYRDQVRKLQKFLVDNGFPVYGIDGIYGPYTKKAEAAYIASLKGKEDPERPIIATISDSRERLIDVARSCIGYRELSNNNDGAHIDDILDSVGLRGTRQPYCAAFIVYCGDLAFGRDKNPFPRSAWSPDMVANPTWRQHLGGTTPLPGDTFGIYFASRGRIAHAGLILDWLNNDPKYCLTIEANTSEAGAVGTERDRDGDGVYMKRRHKSDIYAVRNWIS